MRKILASATVWIVALVLFISTISFGATSIDFLAPACLLVVLGIFLWVYKLFFADVVSWKQSPMHVPVLLFLAYAWVRYYQSPVEYDSRFELLQIGLYSLFFFLLASNCYRSRDRKILLLTLMVLATGESIYAIWQIATKAQTVLGASRPTQYYNRGGGTFFCPNHLAGFLEMALGLFLGCVVFKRSSKGSVEKSALQKVFLIYVALVSLVGIVVSLSRGGWIATLVAMVALLFWGDWSMRMLWRRVIAVVAGLSIFGFLLWNLPPVRTYIQLTFMSPPGKTPLGLKDPSLGGRTVMVGSTLKIIQENFWLGTGPNTWQWAYLKHRQPEDQTHPDYAHNDILNVASDYGLVGLTLVLLALAAFFWQARVLSRNSGSSEPRSWAIGSMIGVTAILVHSWVDFNMHVPANALLLVTLLGVTVAMDDSGERWRRVELKPWLRYVTAILLLCFCAVGVKTLLPTYMGDYYNNIGRKYKRDLELDYALTSFNQAISWDPAFPEPFEKKGDIYRTQALFRRDPAKQTERTLLLGKAAVNYQQSLELNPYQTEIMLRLADVHELAENTDAAAKLYEQAIANDPNNALTYFRQGLFYRHLDKEDLALEAFEKSKRLNFWSDNSAARNVEELRSRKQAAPGPGIYPRPVRPPVRRPMPSILYLGVELMEGSREGNEGSEGTDDVGWPLRSPHHEACGPRPAAPSAGTSLSSPPLRAILDRGGTRHGTRVNTLGTHRALLPRGSGQFRFAKLPTFP